MFEIYNKRKQFWQWDTGQRLIVHDDSCSEVHFCNGTTECALVCEVYEEDGLRLVNVPNIFFQTTEPIRVFAFICQGEDQHTEVADVFRVRERTKPDNYVYTETEVLDYRRYENIARELNAQSKTYADNASESAAEAKRSEEAAKGSENSAKESSDKAAAYLADTKQAMENAASSAKAAGESRDAAALSEKNASESGKSAAASAESAKTAEEAADRSVSGGAYIVMSVGEDGCLYLEKTDNATDLDITLGEDGNLYMEVNING